MTSHTFSPAEEIPLPTTTAQDFKLLDHPTGALIANQVDMTDEERVALIFSIGPYPNDAAGIATLRVFRAAAAGTAVATAHRRG